MKKHSLFPHAYDEISLVDIGAAGSADVLIAKRATGIAKKKPREKSEDFLEASRARQKKLATKERKKELRSQENPCSTATNSTGKKTGKSSERAKTWKEEKHARDEEGKMAATSSESKAENGKGGTTKAKLDAACRTKSKGKGRRDRAQKVTKSALSTWDKF